MKEKQITISKDLILELLIRELKFQLEKTRKANYDQHLESPVNYQAAAEVTADKILNSMRPALVHQLRSLIEPVAKNNLNEAQYKLGDNQY